MNWLLNNEIATRQEIRDMRSRDGIALASASVSTGLESLRNLTVLQQELDKVPGADSAQVQWKGADVSSESWIMRANKELHELKILIEGSRKQIEDAEKTTSSELVKQMTTVDLPELTRACDALGWLVRLFRLLSSNPEAKRLCEQQVSFGEFLKRKIKVPLDSQGIEHLLFGHQIISALRHTYYQNGFGVTLVFTDIIMKLETPRDTDAYIRTKKMLSNISITHAQLNYVRELGLVNWWLQPAFLSKAAQLCLDDEYFKKYSALYRLYSSLDELGRGDMLRCSVLNLNDSTQGPAAMNNTNSGIESFIHRRPLCEGFTPESVVIDISTTITDSLTIKEQFDFTAHFLFSAKKEIEDRRVEQSNINRLTGGLRSHGTGKAEKVNAILQDDPDLNLHPASEGTFAGAESINALKEGTPKPPPAPLGACPINCGTKHKLQSCFFCDKFRDLKDKLSVVKSVPLCVICLQPKHKDANGKWTDECRCNHRCRRCNGEHNTLLHDNLSGTESVNMVSTLVSGSGPAYDNIAGDGSDMVDADFDTIYAINGNLSQKLKVDKKSLDCLMDLVSRIEPAKYDLDYDKLSNEEKQSISSAVMRLNHKILDERKAVAAGKTSGNEEKVLHADSSHTNPVNDFLSSEECFNIALGASQVDTKGASNIYNPPLSRPTNNNMDSLIQTEGASCLGTSGKNMSSQLTSHVSAMNGNLLNHIQDPDNCDEKHFYEAYCSNSLHNKLIQAEEIINYHSERKILNYVVVDVTVPSPTQQKIDSLKRVPNLTIHVLGGVTLCRLVALHDPGSTLSVGRADLIEALEAPPVERFEKDIKTVTGVGRIEDNKYSIQIKAGKYSHVTSVVKLPSVTTCKGFSCSELALVELLFGLDHRNVANVNLPDVDQEGHILLGQGEHDLILLPIMDPRSLGLDTRYFSRGLMLFYCYFSQSKKFVVSGHYGTKKKLIDKSLNFPRFPIPSNMEPMVVEIQVQRLIDLMMKPQELINSSSLVSMRLRNQGLVYPDTNVNNQWVINHVTSELARACVLDISQDSSNNDVSSSQLDIRPGSLECLDLYEQCHFTSTDATTILNYLAGEAALLNPRVLCKSHQNLADKLATDCPSCVHYHSSVDMESQKARFDVLWDKINAVPDPDKGGDYKKIVVSMPFKDDVSSFGRLHQLMIPEALRFSKKVIKKSSQFGAEKILHSQIRDKLHCKFITRLSIDEIEKIHNGEIYAQSYLRNYAINLNSSSTPIRFVCNTNSKIPFTPNQTLCSADPCPAFDLVSLLHMGIRQKLTPIFCSLDLAKAYLSLHCSPEMKKMFLSTWFMNIDDPDHPELPIICENDRIDFGFSSASMCLKIGMCKECAKEVKLDTSRQTLKDSTYVDNIECVNCKSVREMANQIIDLKLSLAKLGLIIDKIYCSKAIWDHDDMAEVRELFDNKFKAATNSLGNRWNTISDLVLPNINLNTHEGHRGLAGGCDLKSQDFNEEPLTRYALCKITPGLWDQLGCYIGPLLSTAKMFLSAVCKVVPMDRMKDPIGLYDAELAKLVHKFWRNVTDTPLIPWERSFLKEGYKITRVYADHDGSHVGIAAVVIIMCENDDGDKQTHTILCKSVVSNDSPISNEARSNSIACSLLVTFFSAVKPILDRFDDNVEIISIGDNIPVSHLFQYEPKGTLLRNIRNQCLRSLITIHKLIKNTTIKFAWLPSRFLTSEYASKIYLNAPSIVNTARWRAGHSILLQPEIASHFWYLFSDGVKITFRALPTLDVKGTLEDTIAANPLTDLHYVVFDQNDNIVEETQRKNDEFVSHILSTPEWTPQDIKSDSVMTLNDLATLVSSDQEVNLDSAFPCFTAELELEENDPGFHAENALVAYDYIRKFHLMLEPTDFFEKEKLREENSELGFGPTSESCEHVNSLSHWRPPFRQSDFQSEHLSAGTNILSGVMAPEPFPRDFYLLVIGISNNVIRIINHILLLKKCFKKKPQSLENINLSEADDEVTHVWAKLVASDQKWFPAATKKDQTSMVNGFLVVSLRLENVTLPVLDGAGPLLYKTIDTHHREFNGLWSDLTQVSHVGLVRLRTKVMNSKFGLYGFQLDSQVKKVLEDCKVCLRNQLRAFKIPPGQRFVNVKPEMDLFAECACDPVGPLTLKQYKSQRKANLQVYILVVVCMQSSAVILQCVGDLTAASITLGLKCAERKHNIAIRELHVDKGSSLRSNLLEHDLRSWRVIQHSATGHWRVYSESKTRCFRMLWNKLNAKFARESKLAVPINIYQFLFLLNDIQLSLNQQPYTNGSRMSPSVLLHSRGLRHLMTCNDMEQAEAGDKSMQPLAMWLKEVRDFRYDLLCARLKEQSSIQTDVDIFRPMTGDVVLALTGNMTTSETCVVTAAPGCPTDSEHPDKEKVSQNTVLVRNGNKHERLYPVKSLRLLVAGPLNRQLSHKVELSGNFVTRLANSKQFKFKYYRFGSVMFSPTRPKCMKYVQSNSLSLSSLQSFSKLVSTTTDTLSFSSRPSLLVIMRTLPILILMSLILPGAPAPLADPGIQVGASLKYESGNYDTNGRTQWPNGWIDETFEQHSKDIEDIFRGLHETDTYHTIAIWSSFGVTWVAIIVVLVLRCSNLSSMHVYILTFLFLSTDSSMTAAWARTRTRATPRTPWTGAWRTSTPRPATGGAAAWTTRGCPSPSPSTTRRSNWRLRNEDTRPCIFINKNQIFNHELYFTGHVAGYRIALTSISLPTTPPIMTMYPLSAVCSNFSKTLSVTNSVTSAPPSPLCQVRSTATSHCTPNRFSAS